MKVLHAYVLLALALILTAASPAVAQAQQKSESFVAKVAVSDEAVTFETDGRYDGFVMKVAGPDDFFLQQSFTGDEAPNLRLKTERGLLVDGSYTIEVTASPYFSKEARVALEQSRGDNAKTREILAEAGIGQRDMVYSINLGIAEGKFIDPYLEEAVGEDMGALDIGSIAPAPGYVAPPDVTAAGPRFAFQTVDDTARPQFVSSEGDPDSPWMETVFKNTAPDGAELVYQGYMRPVQSENAAPLFLAFFRTVSANGVEGEWYRGYFEFSGDGFRMVNAPGTAAAGQQPFDYLTEDAPPPAEPRRRDHFIVDDIVGTFSLCIGTDCVNGESFGFTTIKLKENNLRIEFRDTSNSASFPFVDWQLTANDSANGGANKFSIDDLHNGRTPFTIEAAAPSHSLYVDDGGRIGLGTSTPVVELHIKDGDTPTLRLEQDGSSGFQPQTWDVAGNETNFFVRDATNGSPLPFKIRPSAPNNSLYIDTNGDMGKGTASPAADLHVVATGTDNDDVLRLDRAGSPRFTLMNTTAGSGTEEWNFRLNGADDFVISAAGSGVTEFLLEGATGNLTLAGNCSDAAGGGGCTPDYVFEPDYEMMTLAELEAFIAQNKHLPNVPSAAEVEANGFSVKGMSNAILEKVEELVLHTIEQQKTIEALQARVKALEDAQK